MATYTFTTDSLQEATLTVVAAIPPTAMPGSIPLPVPTNTEFFTTLVTNLLANLAIRNQDDLLNNALQNYFVSTPAVQTKVLQLLGLTDFAGLAQPAQQKAFSALAKPAFLALDRPTQVQIFALLGY
jgi:hypothetical protein